MLLCTDAGFATSGKGAGVAGGDPLGAVVGVCVGVASGDGDSDGSGVAKGVSDGAGVGDSWALMRAAGMHDATSNKKTTRAYLEKTGRK